MEKKSKEWGEDRRWRDERLERVGEDVMGTYRHRGLLGCLLVSIVEPRPRRHRAVMPTSRTMLSSSSLLLIPSSIIANPQGNFTLEVEYDRDGERFNGIRLDALIFLHDYY